MLTQFPDWFMMVHPDPSSDLVDRRWSFIEDISSEISFEDIIELARMYYGKPCRSKEFVEEFPALVQKHDSAFAPTHHKREIALLAGVVLANLATESNLCIFSALCPQFYGLAKNQSDFVKTFTPFIENVLSDRARKLRSKIKTISNELKQFALPDLNALTSPWEPAKFPQNGQTISTHINNLFANVKDIYDSISVLTNERLLYAEESDILWWLVGGYSRDLQLPFENNNSSLPLIIGKELAEMVSVLPGPYSANAILERALLQSKNGKDKITIESLLSALPPKWLSMYTSELTAFNIFEVSPIDLLPIHWSILRVSEDNSLASWHSSFENIFGIATKAETTPLIIAGQMYRECLLIKSFNSQKEL
jgi:hypothetical protein